MIDRRRFVGMGTLAAGALATSHWSASLGSNRGECREGHAGRHRRDTLRQDSRLKPREGASLQRRAVWRIHRPAPPLHAAAQAGKMDRRARLLRARQAFTAVAVRFPRLRAAGSRSHGSQRADERRLPDAERLDAQRRRGQTARDGVAARRWLHQRLRRIHLLRRPRARGQERRRSRDGESPTQRIRLSLSGRPRRREVRERFERRQSRYRRRARMGSRQHRRIRWRSFERHADGAIGWRRQGELADGDARRKGPVPQGHRSERRARSKACRRTRRTRTPRWC